MSILRNQIGVYSLICAKPNRYLRFKDTQSHYLWEREERLCRGYLEEFQRLTTIYFKKHGRITVGDIAEMEQEYINQLRGA